VIRWLPLLLAGCATPLSALTDHRQLTTPMGPVIIRSAPWAQPEDPATVARAVEQATPKLARWGPLDRAVDVFVMPTHADLESAVRRRGYDWLRAWAQYDDVLVQAPSTWTHDERDVVELLAHELTHCLMYQKAATAEDWVRKTIPLWFREGMATFTAEQGYRWMTLEDLAHVYERERDPIVQAEELYQTKSGAVYAAAHYAFTFLFKRYGAEGVERVLYGMSKGMPFDAAFEAGIGLTTVEFTGEFRRFVVWRAFRGSGKRVSAQ